MPDNDAPGLIIVYTGNGKGKTTAALGLCLRAVGHGNKVSIVQFIKSEWSYGELKSIKRLAPDVEIIPLGAGCVGILDDDKPIEEHREAAQKTYEVARAKIERDEFDLVILDEINIAVHLGLLDVDDMMKIIKIKPQRLNLVFTGRNAPERLIDAADLVTEMKEIRHPFRKGIKSIKGVDY